MGKRERGWEVRERGAQERDGDGMQWGKGEKSAQTKFSSFHYICCLTRSEFNLYDLSFSLSFFSILSIKMHNDLEYYYKHLLYCLKYMNSLMT